MTERKTILLPADAAPAAARAAEEAAEERDRAEIARITLERALQLDA